MRVIRAGTRVRLNDHGCATFPTLADIGGELEGYNSPELARVLFDNHRTPITLHRSCLMEDGSKVISKGRPTITEKNAVKADNRKVLVEAFRIVRFNSAEKVVTKNLRDAIAGRRPVTPSIIETARQIILDHVH